MEKESLMGKAARIYLMNMVQMVELNDVSEADRAKLSKAFGVFCARLVRLAESMNAAPDEALEPSGECPRTISVQNGYGVPLTERYLLSPDVTLEAAGKALTEVLETLGTVVSRDKDLSEVGRNNKAALTDGGTGKERL